MRYRPLGTRTLNRLPDRSHARIPAQVNRAHWNSGSREKRSSGPGTILCSGRSGQRDSVSSSSQYHTLPRPSSFSHLLFDQFIRDIVALHLDRVPDFHVPSFVIDLPVEHLIDRTDKECLSFFVHVKTTRNGIEIFLGYLPLHEQIDHRFVDVSPE